MDNANVIAIAAVDDAAAAAIAPRLTDAEEDIYQIKREAGLDPVKENKNGDCEADDVKSFSQAPRKRVEEN